MSVFRNTLQGSAAPYIALRFYLIDFFDGDINTALFVERLQFLLSRTDDPRGTYQSREGWYAETRLTPRQIDSVRKKLMARGYLAETHDRRNHKVYYALNEKALDADFVPFSKAYFSKNSEIDFTYDGVSVVSKLNLSRVEKRTQGALTQTATAPNKSARPSYTKRKSLYTEEVTEEDAGERSARLTARRTRPVKSVSTSVKSFDTIDSALQGLKENKEARAARRIAGGDPAKVVNPKTFPKMKVVNDTWRAVMKEHHPKIPALRLGITDYAKFRACAKQVLETASLYELLDFAASAWDTIVTHDLAWVVRKGGRLPQAPSMQEICRFWKTFSKAFAERSAHAALGEARREATQTNERKLERDNEGLRAELAKRDAEAKKLKDQLRMEKQISTGLSRKLRETPEKKGQTITARRAALPDDIGDDEINFIPDWQKGAQK